MIIDIISKKLTQKPQNIFLLDGIGAFVSAFFLFGVLKKFQTHFGMPSNILDVLSFIAMIFCVYSLSCFFFIKKTWKPFLKLIIF
jgi:hypothetical protein